MRGPRYPHERHVALVADADDAVRAAARSLLEAEGLDVEVAGTGAHALELIERAAPCLALLDLDLPDGDGLALCRVLMQEARISDVAVLLLAAPGRPESAALAAASAGAVDYVRKPFDRDELAFRVRSHLRLHEAQMRQRSVQERLAALSRASREASVMIDAEGNISQWNKAAAAMFGWAQHEALGKNLHALLAPARFQGDYARAFPAFRAAGKGNAVGRTLELCARRKSGEEFPIELSLSPTEVNGEWWARGFVRDLSERQRVERALRESEGRLRLLESVPVGIALVGRDRRVRWANRAALEMTQAGGLEDLAGRPCGEVLCQGASCPALDGERSLGQVEKQLPRRAGPPIPVLWSVHEVELEEERLLLEAFIDLRPRKQLEAELGHARKLEAVGQLAAGIAHEINTPTQYVGDSLQFLKEAFDAFSRLMPLYRGALDTLRERGGGEAALREVEGLERELDLAFLAQSVPRSFSLCQDGVARIASIVRAMKEFAHPDRREKSPADLNAALESTLTIARNEYKYVADVQTELGELPPVVCHVGDLNQVFLNLIVNAAHAIAASVAESRARGTIRVRTQREGDAARIDIADTGVGIPEAIRARVFEPFFTTKPVGQGSGQGLAIARSIVVDKHGGALTFESEVGRGTTFTVRVPIDGAPSEPEVLP